MLGATVLGGSSFHRPADLKSHRFGTPPLCEAQTTGRKALDSDPWDTWIIPEYQDRQRFEKPGNGSPYDPVTCIVARPRLNAVTDFSKGVTVAVIDVDTTDAANPGQRIAPKDLGGSYKALNLWSGWNCLVIRYDGTKWAARMVPTDVNTRACVADFSKPANDVQITAVSDPNAGTNDYPPVARFVMDVNWKAGIGVRCGMAWCTIGIPPGQVKNALQPAPGLGSSGHFHASIPGWYDDQRLAVTDAGNVPPIKPQMEASIIPHYNLGAFTIDKNFDVGRTPVASVYFSSDPTGSKYDTIWSFKKSTDLASENLIELQHDKTKGRDDGWTVYINGVLNTKLHVVRHGHGGMVIPGTARWAWSETDETLWVRCDDGCCEVEPTRD
jgi:hypothetical protein